MPRRGAASMKEQACSADTTWSSMQRRWKALPSSASWRVTTSRWKALPRAFEQQKASQAGRRSPNIALPLVANIATVRHYITLPFGIYLGMQNLSDDIGQKPCILHKLASNLRKRAGLHFWKLCSFKNILHLSRHMLEFELVILQSSNCGDDGKESIGVGETGVLASLTVDAFMAKSAFELPELEASSCARMSVDWSLSSQMPAQYGENLSENAANANANACEEPQEKLVQALHC